MWMYDVTILLINDIKKGKTGNVEDIKPGKKLKAIFKLVTSLVQVLNEVKSTRLVYRDQGI